MLGKASALFTGVSGPTITAARNFYGVVRVTHDDSGKFVQLVHGNTVHGMQSNAPALHDQPLGYYHRKGPLGAIFGEVQPDKPLNRTVKMYNNSGKPLTLEPIPIPAGSPTGVVRPSSTRTSSSLR